ncbi:unnamed protein product [Ambrosiozyma monospora]|uniref:Alkyl transferase n=1 Tax=Ambrosiozyma monospora TaxID=43982 RepID=A0A9W6SZT0_AMBMO|nr:unnamed protein product [Ambrosiozyma monospora]
MSLFKKKFKQVLEHGDLCETYGVRIRVVGNVKLLPKDVRQVLDEAEEMTKNNTRAILNVCAPYTSRDDMTHAIRNIVKEGINSKDITEDTIGKHLYSGPVPKMELLVRTSNVYRLSDFMLWEAVDLDCDIEILDILWPEFTPLRLVWILLKWGFNRTYYGHRTANLLNLNNGPDDDSHSTTSISQSQSQLKKTT